MPKRAFKDLDEKEILALAISLEEEDARVYGDFAEGLREASPSTAKMFEEMQAEESRHRAALGGEDSDRAGWEGIRRMSQFPSSIMSRRGLSGLCNLPLCAVSTRPLPRQFADKPSSRCTPQQGTFNAR